MWVSTPERVRSSLMRPRPRCRPGRLKGDPGPINADGAISKGRWLWIPALAALGRDDRHGARSCGFLTERAEVSLLHHRRRHHLGGLAVGDELAVVQDDDAVSERAHHVHLVLDQ